MFNILLSLAAVFMLSSVQANPAGTAPVVLDGGTFHQCARARAGGEVKCWGVPNPYNDGNTYGQAEDRTFTNLVDFAAGDYTNCALLDTGNTECWGYNSDLLSYTGADATELGVGYGQACVVTQEKNVKCIGFYFRDENGNSLAFKWGDVYTGGDAEWVGLSSYAMCIKKAGYSELTCQGWNVSETTWVLDAGTALPVVAGHYAPCVLLDNGNVDCMNNTYNELGQTNIKYFRGDAIDMDAAFDLSCVATSTGNVECWGRRDSRYPNISWVVASNVGAVSLSVNSYDLCYSNQAGEITCTNSTPDEITPPVLDSDGDGVNDDVDAFPNDPSESVDSDGDGVGDNGDAFPNDATESADSDGDGVGDNADVNDASDTSDTVSVLGNITSVENRVQTDGVTIADMVNQAVSDCDGSSKNHGQFASCMARFLNGLVKADVISDAEKGILQSTVARTDVGKKNKR